MGFRGIKTLFVSWSLLQMAVKRTNVLAVFLTASCMNTVQKLMKGTWGSNTEEQ